MYGLPRTYYLADETIRIIDCISEHQGVSKSNSLDTIVKEWTAYKAQEPGTKATLALSNEELTTVIKELADVCRTTSRGLDDLHSQVQFNLEILKTASEQA